MRLLSCLVATVMSTSSYGVAAPDDDSIHTKLERALQEYDETVTAARDQIKSSLKTAQMQAQKSGQLSRFQAIRKELDAFESDSKLPTSISTARYVRTLKRALAMIETAYASAISAYTRKGNIGLATELQAELKEIRTTGFLPLGPIRVDSVWVAPKGSDKKHRFKILARTQNSFEAQFTVNERIERIVKGKISGNRISWLAKNVRAVKGSAGGDNFGVIRQGQAGTNYQIHFTWQATSGVVGGEFILVQQPEN